MGDWRTIGYTSRICSWYEPTPTDILTAPNLGLNVSRGGCLVLRRVSLSQDRGGGISREYATWRHVQG